MRERSGRNLRADRHATNRPQRAGASAALVLAALLAAAAQARSTASQDAPLSPAAPPAAGVVPARLLDAGDSAARSRCYSDVLRRAGAELTGIVTLLIGTDGRASVDAWPVGVSPEFQKTVECVLPLMRFKPATEAGTPVASRMNMPFQLALTDAVDQAVVVRPPVAVSRPEDRARARAACVPEGLQATSAPILALEVDTGGKVVRARVVESSGDPRVDEAARCIARKTRFAPGTRNGYLQRMTITTRVGLGD